MAALYSNLSLLKCANAVFDVFVETGLYLTNFSPKSICSYWTSGLHVMRIVL